MWRAWRCSRPRWSSASPVRRRSAGFCSSGRSAMSWKCPHDVRTRRSVFYSVILVSVARYVTCEEVESGRPRGRQPQPSPLQGGHDRDFTTGCGKRECGRTLMTLHDERNPVRDGELGMDRAVTRRDFLNGLAIGIGGLVAGSWLARLDAEAAAQFTQDAAGYYPPALTGMRGSHDGSF